MANNRGSIGGRDSNGKNDWDVDSNGNIVPGSDDARSIGSSSKALTNMYIKKTFNLGGLEITVSGSNLYFNGDLVTTS